MEDRELQLSLELQLRELLEAQEWDQADELTAKLMLQVVGCESEGWLRDEDIENFSWQDLKSIDEMWVYYSEGKYGFSVQKKLWLECGGDLDNYDDEVWREFAARVLPASLPFRIGSLVGEGRVERGYSGLISIWKVYENYERRSKVSDLRYGRVNDIEK